VIHCVPSLRAVDGGPTRSVAGLALAQHAAGAQVSILTLISDQALDVADRAGVPVESMGDTGGNRISRRSVRRIREVFDRGVDVVHGHGVWSRFNHHVCREAQRAGAALFVSPRGMLEPWSLRQSRIRKWLAMKLWLRRDLRSAAALVATSEMERDSMLALGLHNAVEIVPNGVDVPRGIEGSPDTATRRSGARQAIFISRLHPKKGIELLIGAWSEVAPPGWHLRIVGPGEPAYRRSLEALVPGSLRSSITFEDAANDERKWRLLSESDLFVLPTYSENFGIVIAEALAAGVPVITTTGTPWQALKEKGCGWWVPPRQESIASVLREAASLPPKELRAMGTRGRSFIAERFSWQRIAAPSLEMYARYRKRADIA